MNCLGIEAATLRPGVGLARDDQVYWEKSEPNPPDKAQAIFVYLDQAIRAGKLDFSDLELVAVTAGPGSFTGLKVGLAAAKGFGFALGLPTVGVSSLKALAWSLAPATEGPVAALFDARKGMLYAGLFEADGDNPPTRISPDRAVTPENLIAELEDLDRPVTLTGQGLAAYGQTFRQGLGEKAVIAPEEAWDIRPGLVARLGIIAAGQGEAVPPAELKAAYLRPVEAVLPKKELKVL